MRNPITSIGEIGVSVGEREWLFRPSLSAIDSLGSPREIVEMFYMLSSAPQINPFWPDQSFRAWERDVVSTAYDVLVACSDDDATPLLGHMGTQWGSFVMGAMPMQDMVHLARSLMRHGVIGIQAKKPVNSRQEDYTEEFNAREFVSQAVAHLGLTADAAWRMTMTEFSGAMKSKFGQPEKKEPNIQKHKAAMNNLAEINRLRKYQVKK